MRRSPRPETTRDRAHRGAGEFDLALADFHRAIQLDPKNAAAWAGRGEIYFRMNQYAKAIADYSRAIDLGGDRATICLDRGRAHAAAQGVGSGHRR